MKTTKQIGLETMILHGKIVKKFTKKSLVVFDMPYKTYENKLMAYKNAKKVIEETSPNGLDISRSLKDENNDISLIKLNELQISLSAA